MKEDRIKKLEDYIVENERASIEELCNMLNVSKNTLRRYINQLEEEAKIKKIYGGIILNDKKTTEPFENRMKRNEEAKRTIARLAASLVKDNDIIFIDSGTTTMHMMPHLAEISNLTIITNNLNVIVDSLSYQNLNVISPGGALFRSTHSFVGAEVITALKKYNISKAFLACTALSIAKGLTNSSSFEYEIKKYLAESCDEIIILADHTKLDRVSLITYCYLKNIQVFVTDANPGNKYVDFFNGNNIKLLTPDV